jgi:hypothetical protein
MLFETVTSTTQKQSLRLGQDWRNESEVAAAWRIEKSSFDRRRANTNNAHNHDTKDYFKHQSRVRLYVRKDILLPLPCTINTV